MDFFASHIVSLVLSWVFCSSIFIGLIGYLSETFFEKAEGIPRVVTIWLSLCLIVLSPLRYILLQQMLCEAYVVQSISAFLSTILLLFYMTIVFGTLCIVGLAPSVVVIGILFDEMIGRVTRTKMFLLCLVTPVGCLLGSYLFTLILPYAAISIHWLKASDVIRSTNGPGYYFHKYAVDVWNPMELFVDEDQRNHTLREHVYTVYFGKKQKASYRKALTVQHFFQSQSYALDAEDAFDKGVPKSGKLIVSIDQGVIDEAMRLKKLALAEAAKVSIEELNDRYPGFGDHYRDEFIEGLTTEVRGYERNETLTDLRGQFLLHNWGKWYMANRERIVNSEEK